MTDHAPPIDVNCAGNVGRGGRGPRMSELFRRRVSHLHRHHQHRGSSSENRGSSVFVEIEIGYSAHSSACDDDERDEDEPRTLEIGCSDGSVSVSSCGDECDDYDNCAGRDERPRRIEIGYSDHSADYGGNECDIDGAAALADTRVGNCCDKMRQRPRVEIGYSDHSLSFDDDGKYDGSIPLGRDEFNKREHSGGTDNIIHGGNNTSGSDSSWMACNTAFASLSSLEEGAKDRAAAAPAAQTLYPILPPSAKNEGDDGMDNLRDSSVDINDDVSNASLDRKPRAKRQGSAAAEDVEDKKLPAVPTTETDSELTSSKGRAKDDAEESAQQASDGGCRRGCGALASRRMSGGGRSSLALSSTTSAKRRLLNMTAVAPGSMNKEDENIRRADNNDEGCHHDSHHRGSTCSPPRQSDRTRLPASAGGPFSSAPTKEEEAHRCLDTNGTDDAPSRGMLVSKDLSPDTCFDNESRVISEASTARRPSNSALASNANVAAASSGRRDTPAAASASTLPTQRGAVKVEGIDPRYGRRGGPRRILNAPASPPLGSESEPVRVNEAELVIEDEQDMRRREHDIIYNHETPGVAGNTTGGTATATAIVESEASVRWARISGVFARAGTVVWGGRNAAAAGAGGASSFNGVTTVEVKRVCSKGIVGCACHDRRKTRLQLCLCLLLLLGVIAALSAGLAVAVRHLRRE